MTTSPRPRTRPAPRALPRKRSSTNTTTARTAISTTSRVVAESYSCVRRSSKRRLLGPRQERSVGRQPCPLQRVEQADGVARRSHVVDAEDQRGAAGQGVAGGGEG